MTRKIAERSHGLISIATPVIDHYYSVKKNKILEFGFEYGCTNFVARRVLNNLKKTLKEHYILTYPGDNARNTLETLGILMRISEFKEYKLAYVGCVGSKDKEYREIFSRSLTENLVQPILYEKNGHFGEILCFVDEFGQRTFVADLGVSEELIVEENEIKNMVLNYSEIYFSSITLLTSKNVAKVANTAKDFGILNKKVIITSLESPKMLESNREKAKNIVRDSAIVFANEEEATAVFGKNYVDKILEIQKEKNSLNQLFFVKLGNQGSMLIKKDNTIKKMPAYKVSKIVDTTAAGDNFIAGALFSLLFFNDEERALALGNLLGALTIQNFGPAIKNIEKYLNKKTLFDMFII
ncbi:MAG: PfkB family carbohydrate kinase [Candidatus Micrarchaeota archaeon]|nr:PfkB family carbohydrate kinase [Candidatus Micrarchaeota archaeon]